MGVPDSTIPDWRMIFMHRNAMDQMLSYYRSIIATSIGRAIHI